jgi:hypothetical protein
MAPRASASSAAQGTQVVVEQVDEIVLGGVKVQVRGQEVPLDRVVLDRENPRLANTVAMASSASGEDVQRKLADTLWADPDVHTLYHAVKDNGGLIERIIVRSNFVVAEGNCRTVVYRKLREKFPADPRWQTIPARVLPADITDRQIAILLGELHVGGKNKWSAFEKAGHIHELAMRHGLVQDEIAKLLRTSKTAVNHNIHAFGALKHRYMPQYPGTGAVHKFSYFYEAYKDQTLRDWFKDSPDGLERFVRWVGTEKIARGAEVRELRDIVVNARALAAFEEGGRDAARKILEHDRPELTSPLFELMLKMTDALDQARLDDVQRVRKDPSGGAKTIVRNLKETLERFVDLCDGVE